MKIYGIIFLAVLTLGGGAMLLQKRHRGEAPKEIPAQASVTACAASSLKEMVTEVATAWTKRSGTPVRLRFEGTPTLARQIQQGAQADLFLSAAPEWLDKVKTLGRYDWLGNRLVAVCRKGEGPVDLKRVSSLALANEQVPAGRHAKAALGALGIPVPGRVVYGENVRDVLSKVSHGAAEGGVVYATDVAIDPAVEVCFRFSEGSHPPVVYSVGLLTERGRPLFMALRESGAMEVAKRHGFLALP